MRNWNGKIVSLKVYGIEGCRWLILGTLTGVLGGTIGAAFAHSISFVTELREANPWLLYLLPVAGFVSIVLYRALRVVHVGTNQVLQSVRTGKPASFLLAPAIFLGSMLTHLCGGSAGREGAALQLGGSITALIGKLLHLRETSLHILTMCGMGAFFAAVFGTPVGACVFALEVVSVGSVNSAAIFPVFVSSISAYRIATALHVHPEHFFIEWIPALEFETIWRVMAIAVVCSLLSAVFCILLHVTEKLMRNLIPNHFTRIFLCGMTIVMMTLALGTTDYNGSGMELIERIFAGGTVRNDAFLLKMLFTVLTVAAGYKGGEIIPTMCIGATLGALLSSLVGLPTEFAAAVGMIAMFCGVTNCPLATIFLGVELFGAEGLIFFALSSATGFLLSGNTRLYDGQQILFSKLDYEKLNSLGKMWTKITHKPIHSAVKSAQSESAVEEAKKGE